MRTIVIEIVLRKLHRYLSKTALKQYVSLGTQIELSPEELMQRTFSEIDLSHLMVIDLTEKGVGLGIEAGYAYAKGIPIAVIAKKGSDISATLQGISQQLFLYDELDDLIDFFKDTTFLGNQMKDSDLY